MKPLITLGLGTLLLSGCVSVLPEPVVPEALYRLRDSAGGAQGQPVSLPVNITVYEPDGSSLLLSRDIVFEEADGALSVVRDAQWSDPASRLLQALLLDRLFIQTPDSQGLALSDATGVLSPVDMRWQARDYMVRENEAVVAFRVTLLSGRTRKVLSQFEVRNSVPYIGKPNEEGVLALIEASRGAVDRLAMALPQNIDQSALTAASSKR